MKIIREENQDKTIFKTKWISVKETSKGFQFLERKGVNSIACFLIKESNRGLLNLKDKYDVLIRYQPLPIDNSSDQDLFPCPITGSIEENETYEDCAMREVYEESGYKIGIPSFIGSYFCSTQSNEEVFMYLYDVTNLSYGIPKGDGEKYESISYNQWEPLTNLKKLFICWMSDRLS